jgi:hypothetical protein
MPRIPERRSVSIGITMAGVFLVVDTLVPLYIGYETLVLIFAVCLLLVCCALIDTARGGLACGLTALAGQSLGEFVRYAIPNGPEIALAVLAYSFLLTLTYPVAGAIGGYIGGKVSTSRRGRSAAGAERSTKSSRSPKPDA